MLVGFEKHPRGKPQFLSAFLETVFEADDTIFVVAEIDRAHGPSKPIGSSRPTLTSGNAPKRYNNLA